jgi:TonB-linked SusC/RagA family outer membrane protein
LCVVALLFIAPLSAQAQSRITGIVSDHNNEPIVGASVIVKGTTIGTVTGINGNYDLASVPDDAVLVFSFVGLEAKEETPDGRTRIDVQMTAADQQIDDVVVVAFGKQKKSSVVSAIEAVNTKDLKIVSSNMTTAFAGKIPGMISYQTSGEPGNDNAKFFVRGVTTFGYKNDPLILIDGFEATTDDLARLQPDDIEGFSILKDASATVLYGPRGANGIVAVSTKQGIDGPIKVSARVDVNVSTPTKMLELLDGVTYMRMYNEALISRAADQGYEAEAWYSEKKIQATARGDNPMVYPNINWYDMLFKSATTNTKANVNVQGGGKMSTYYVAVGYDKETGLLKVDNLNNYNNNIDINRFNMRSNVIFKFGKYTQLDTRISGRFERYNGPYRAADEIFSMVMAGNPVDFPAKWEPNGQFNIRFPMFGNTYPSKDNPYAEMVRGYNERNENTLTTQATLMQDLDMLVKGLKIQAKASISTWGQTGGSRTSQPLYFILRQENDPETGTYSLYPLNPDDNGFLGDVARYRNSETHYYYEVRANWDGKFGDHSLGLMTVATAEERIMRDETGMGSTIQETLPERNIGNSGRFSYNYDECYFAEFSYGYNGSEKFTGDKRFGFFPSIGAAWILSNESFWSSAALQDVIGLVKLKYTWGKVGNDAIAGRTGRFFYLSSISDDAGSGYTWGTTWQNTYAGYLINRYGNPDIGWEESVKHNIGVEIGLLREQALKIQADFFTDVRDKIYLWRQNLPQTMGIENTVHGNAGRMSSKGVDASIDFKKFFTSDLWVTARANLTYAVNKVEAMDEPLYAEEYRRRVGYPWNQQWGYLAERLFVDAAEIFNSPSQVDLGGTYMRGDIKYTDINGDGKIGVEDQIPMGYPTVPEMQYGFGVSSGYKNFDLSFFFQGNAHVSFYIDPAAMAPFVDRRNAPAIVALDSWTPTHPDVHAFWPRLSTGQVANNTQPSSWWLRDGSFLRLKTVEIGYNFNKIEKLKMSACRLYFSGENLLTFSSFKLWDPEVGANGLGYPINRRFNIGIQVGF